MIADCAYCPWQVDVPVDRVDRARAQHVLLRHPDRISDEPQEALPGTPVPTLTAAQWRVRARDAIVLLAARGEPFSAFDVAQVGGVGEPPDSHEWGRLFRDCHHDGLIAQVGWAESRRPTVKGSAAKLWRGTGRRTA